MRLFNLVSLLVTPKVRVVEPSALNRALRRMPKSKPEPAPPADVDDAPHTEAAPSDDNR